MGKFLFALFGALICSQAFAGLHLQRTLPSETKKVRVARPKAPKSIAARKPAFEPERSEFDDPFSTRVISRTVHFWRSSARLPESYRCDEEINGQKILEAEQKALSECQARGLAGCQVKRVAIVKSGPLVCKDLLGNACRAREFYAGCVAEAVVVGR